MDWDCAIAFWAWKVYNTKDSEQKNEKTLNERNQKKGEHKKMKEKSSLAKRLSGLIALSLVLAMTMGITASAATTYWVKWDDNCLYADFDCTDNNVPTELQSGDSIRVSSDTSGYMLIKVNNEEKCLITNTGLFDGKIIKDSYELPGIYRWSIDTNRGYFEIPENTALNSFGEQKQYNGTINLTTYNPESVSTTPTNTSSPTRPSCNHRVVELRTVRETTAT